MTEATTGQGIPVAQLPNRLGRRWVRRSRLEKIPDQPVVHLLRENDPGRLVDQLSGHLGSVVPHVVLDVGGTPAETQRGKSVQIRKLLDRAALGLRDADSWPRIGKLRFRRYALLSWLLKKNMQPTNLARAPHSDTRHLLREYLSSRRPRRTQQEEQLESQGWELAAQNLPWYLYLLSLVFFPVYYGWWVRKGRVARWFMRQRYLSPRESADFPSFAQRLITTPSRWENAEQVRKLLVHAFLADLADSYNRRLRWKWVPKDCYPVLLLRNLRDDNVGKMLVRLINDVRNETGVPDPLLVIGSGAEPLADSDTPSAPVTLETWHETLQEARRKRSNTAWYVPLRVADEPPATDDDPGISLGQTTLSLKRSKALRRVPVALAVLLLLGGGAAYYQQYEHHCGRSLWPWTNTDLWMAGGATAENETASKECVGIADDAHVFGNNFSDPSDQKLTENLKKAQDLIHEENREAERKHLSDLRLPYVTIVYFGTFTGSNPNTTALDGTAKELYGLATAQFHARVNGGAPIRVVLANGGAEMKHAVPVAERIVEYAKREHKAPVIGVIGLGGSWDETAQAIGKFGEAGLAVVGTTSSADHFPGLSPLYHQVGPTNRQQAKLIAHYARTLRDDGQLPPNITVYYNENDPYSRNLGTDVEEEIGTGRVRMHSKHPIPTVDVQCGKDSLAIFAGRADGFSNFLKSAVQDKCNEPGNYPHLLASDDVTKYLLEDTTLFKGTVLDYISFTGTAPEWTPDLPQAVRENGEFKGRATLAFDAAELLRQAVVRVTSGDVTTSKVPLNGLTVWQGIARITGGDHTDPASPPGINATSGRLDFTKPSNQVPVNKAIYVLRLTAGSAEPVSVLSCGAIGRPTPACP